LLLLLLAYLCWLALRYLKFKQHKDPRHLAIDIAYLSPSIRIPSPLASMTVRIFHSKLDTFLLLGTSKSTSKQRRVMIVLGTLLASLPPGIGGSKWLCEEKKKVGFFLRETLFYGSGISADITSRA